MSDTDLLDPEADEVVDAELVDLLNDQEFHELEHEEFEVALASLDDVIEAFMWLLQVLDPMLPQVMGLSKKQEHDMVRAIAMVGKAAAIRNVKMREDEK